MWRVRAGELCRHGCRSFELTQPVLAVPESQHRLLLVTDTVCILQSGQARELKIVVSHMLDSYHHLPHYAELHTP
jgi:hypothetical protein